MGTTSISPTSCSLKPLWPQLASPPPALDPAAARVAALSVASAAVLSPAGSLLSAAGRTVSTVQGRSGVLRPQSPWNRQGLQVAMWKWGHRCHRLARGALISPLCPSFNVRLIKDSAKLINMPQIGFIFFFSPLLQPVLSCCRDLGPVNVPTSRWQPGALHVQFQSVWLWRCHI